MHWFHVSRLACPLLLLSASLVFAEDWPQWGGHGDRNFASATEKGIPATFNPGEYRKDNNREIDPATTKNVLWTASLGTQTYGNPTIAGGKVFIGTNAAALRDPLQRKDRGGALLCLDEKTGKRLWELHVPRFKTDPAKHAFFHNDLKTFNFDDMDLGVCSSPTVDGDRVYLVTNRSELLCLTVDGLNGGKNVGPFTDEAQFIAGPGNPPAAVSAGTGDIVWCVDMITHPLVKSWVQDAADCSVLVIGDLVYVSPSNGVDRSHRNIPSPEAPMLIAVNKKTGEVLARDDAAIGRTLFHGTWSSPCTGTGNGKALIFFGGPNGWCYALDPTPVDTPGQELKTLKVVWKCDVNPSYRRLRDGKLMPYRARNAQGYGDGPSECIATPVFYKGRVYIDVGQDPRHGKGLGCLTCIDAGASGGGTGGASGGSSGGDVTKTGILWQYDKLDRSLSTVSIYDGLLFVADFSGVLHCLDADTGKVYWTFDTGARIWSSTFAVDGKVYLTTEKEEMHVFAAAKEMKLLGKVKLGDKSYTTPVVANGVLYVTSQSQVWAIKEGGK